MPFELTDMLRLTAAILAGACIGVERELNDKPAGLRTNILICLGAAMFTLLSERMAAGGAADRARIAAQVVTGVGFLGAGAIIQFRGNVIGLTTAATIWAVASVGMAFGGGAYVTGFVATVLTVAVLFGLAFVERQLARWRQTVTFDIDMKPTPEAAQIIERIVRECSLQCDSWIISENESTCRGRLEVTGSRQRLQQLQAALFGDPSVRSVRRE